MEAFLRGGCLGEGVVSALLGAGVGPESGGRHGGAGVWAVGMVATAGVGFGLVVQMGPRRREFMEVALWYRWKVRCGFIFRRRRR